MKEPLFSKILYATDLSETAKKAARYALSLANKYGAQLTAINVVPDMVEEMSAGTGYDLASHYAKDTLNVFNKERHEASEKAIYERIHTVCKQAGNPQPICAVVVKAGHPVEQIVKMATEGGFDLVIMGTHGHSMLENLLIGSVARGVVKNCPVPVLTVRL